MKLTECFTLTEHLMATVKYWAHLCTAHTALWPKVSSGVLHGPGLLTHAPSTLQTIATIRFATAPCCYVFACTVCVVVHEVQEASVDVQVPCES